MRTLSQLAVVCLTTALLGAAPADACILHIVNKAQAPVKVTLSNGKTFTVHGWSTSTPVASTDAKGQQIVTSHAGPGNVYALLAPGGGITINEQTAHLSAACELPSAIATSATPFGLEQLVVESGPDR